MVLTNLEDMVGQKVEVYFLADVDDDDPTCFCRRVTGATVAGVYVSGKVYSNEEPGHDTLAFFPWAALYRLEFVP